MFGIIIKGCDFMQFEILTIEEYLTFFNSFKYSHFLQSVTWALVNKETRNKAYSYQIADMLEKPFNVQVVRHRIENLINLYKSSNAINSIDTC